MNKSIDCNNFRQAATSISEYCRDKSKGKAKNGAIAEAISKFLGYTNSNVASASKLIDGVSTPISFILYTKGVSTIYNDIDDIAYDIFWELKSSSKKYESLKFHTHLTDDKENILLIDDGKKYYLGGFGPFPLFSIQANIIKKPIPYVFSEKDKNEYYELYKDLGECLHDSFWNKNARSTFYNLLSDNPDRSTKDIALGAAINQDLLKETQLENALSIFNKAKIETGSPTKLESIQSLLKPELSGMTALELTSRWRLQKHFVLKSI